jgi:FkbM family methyltransferase
MRSESYIDTVAKAAIRGAVSLLPERSTRYILTSIAKRTGVSLLQVTGKHGDILGAIDDDGVLGGYWRGRDPSVSLVSYLDEFFSSGQGGTLIDIGANIGLFAIPLLRKHAIDCHLFEPNPLNYRLLCWNLHNSRCVGSFKTYQLALLDRKMQVELELSPMNHGDHRVRVTSREQVSSLPNAFREQERPTIPVTAVALDDVLCAETLRRPIAIKIDSQGAEAHIIRGASAMLRAADVLMFEFWPYGLRRMNASVSEFFDQLQRSFRVGAFLEAHNRRTDEKSDEVIPDSFRPIDAVISRLDKLYSETDSIKHGDVIACR